MADLLFEIGCEEIPASSATGALTFMKERIEQDLIGLGFPVPKEITPFATPRRLGFLVKGIPERQQDRTERVQGPKVTIAFDAEGKPTKAGMGFARGQGVSPEALEREETPKGEVVVAIKEVKGQATKDLLQEILPELMRKIPFPKQMRWGTETQHFVRPIHWVLALFHDKVIPFEFAGVQSGNQSRGHRFMKPETFEVRESDLFFTRLNQAYVIPFPNERQDAIREEARRLAKEVGGVARLDDDLVNEVANLVEWPFVLRGSFEESFLQVPQEILIESMQSHQKYFPILDDQGALKNHFVVVANTRVDDPKVVVNGNGRVLRARLSDAEYFFKADRKKKLEDFAPGLSGVTFQEDLGTLADKVERITQLVRTLAAKMDPQALDQALRAAALCKADLLTHVVYEFPEVQGIIGRQYALADGEDHDVAWAIEEHYQPRFADDALPRTRAGMLVSLADKIDTLCGIFGVGLIPSGSADPYALRRQTIGIIRTILVPHHKLNLSEIVDAELKLLGSRLKRPADEVKRDVMQFIKVRLRTILCEDHAQDVVDAVLAAGCEDLLDAKGRVKALHRFRDHESYAPLMTAFKRASRILKDQTPGEKIDESRLEEDAERTLWAAIKHARVRVTDAMEEARYADVLTEMASFKEPVDAFFNDVMVMADDPVVKANRLNLLGHLVRLFGRVADFEKIQAASTK